MNRPVIHASSRGGSISHSKFFILAILSLGMPLVFSSCALLKREPKPVVLPPKAPELVGQIVQTDKTYGFAVLDIGSYGGLLPGTKLEVRRADKKVGAVKVGDQAIRPFVTADIVDGDVQMGDQAFRIR